MVCESLMTACRRHRAAGKLLYERRVPDRSGAALVRGRNYEMLAAWLREEPSTNAG
jgi:hypothetical protein